MYFSPFPKPNQTLTKFQRLLKPLLWTKGVEFVKVLNALGPFRAKSIVGLPPRLTSFRIMSSESVFSANNLSTKKVFWYKKVLLLALFGPFKVLFGPFLTLFNAKIYFLAHVVEIYPPISSLCPPVSTPPIPDARIPQLMLQWVLCAFDNVFILYSEEPLIYWTFYISVKEESFVLFFSGNASLPACFGKCRNNRVKKILNSIQIPNQLQRNQLQNQMPWQIVDYKG